MNYKTLKARQRAERAGHSESVALRVHRALSWLDRSEQERSDPDARFIFLWIAFNAAYATESHVAEMTETRNFQKFLRTLLQLDEKNRIFNLIWTEFSHSIRVLLDNPYVFNDFWRHHQGELDEREWEARFKSLRSKAQRALAQGDTHVVLSIVLARLYVLRNQLLHGGATWKSQVNRDQVRDCAKLLGKLVPVMIEIMLDHPTHDWGPATYPVITT